MQQKTNITDTMEVTQLLLFPTTKARMWNVRAQA